MGDGSSKMAQLYEATFGVPPSKFTSTAMLRMEQLAGLQEDEWLAKVIVIQLRIADITMAVCKHSQETQGKHLQSQKESMEKFQLAVYDWAKLKSALEKSANDWSKPPALSDSMVRVQVYGKDFPLLAHLRNAVHFANDDVEGDERIFAARWSVFYFIAFTASVAMTGALVAAHFLQG